MLCPCLLASKYRVGFSERAYPSFGERCVVKKSPRVTELHFVDSTLSYKHRDYLRKEKWGCAVLVRYWWTVLSYKNGPTIPLYHSLLASLDRLHLTSFGMYGLYLRACTILWTLSFIIPVSRKHALRDFLEESVKLCITKASFELIVEGFLSPDRPSFTFLTVLTASNFFKQFLKQRIMKLLTKNWEHNFLVVV